MSSESPKFQNQAVRDKQLPGQVFQEMEQRDENQILAEMRGEQLQEFVYSIELNGLHFSIEEV